MRQFSYVVKDEVGLHARPAGQLVQEAKKYDSRITVLNKANGKSAAATMLIALMGLGVKRGNEIIVSAEGGDEEAAVAGLKAFVEQNL